jgi:hypothetical protein
MAGRRLIGVIIILVAALASGPVLAAGADVFEVRDIAVDVTAKTAAAAREQAISQGQQAAFRRLLERLTLSTDHGNLPQFEAGEITPFVNDFSISDEKTSAVRYLAKLHFRFKADDIRKLLRNAGLQFAETPSKPVLVLPVFQSAGGLVLWEDPNPWRDAWNRRQSGSGLVTLALPLGDLTDISAVNVQQAVRGEVDALGKLATRYHAGDSVVVYARLGLNPEGQGQRVDVSATRFSPHHEPDTKLMALDQQGQETVEALLKRAADSVGASLEDQWKRDNLLTGGESGVAAVTVPITGLADWLRVQKKLKSVAVVRSIETVLMSLDEVRVNLHYVGAAQQLQTALGQSDLSLVREENEWVLYPAGTVPATKR